MEFNSINLTKELGTNFIEYAAAVNGDRAIPDARSGLKPVARRILYGASVGGYTFSKPYKKSGRLVGEVMGKYHPHGDSSIYGAMVRLSQPWVMRYPLMDFHGNMGNIGGDGPAAMRYTNIRLAKISEDGMLEGLKKRNVDFIPNYDEDDEEPVTLPAIFPNLLCNPNTGIGVAMACNWLPHNLNEVATAIFDYLDNKEPNIPGPDFPTGGLIINGSELPDIIKKGRGSVKVRAKYKVEKNNLVFYEIPYGVTTEALINEIGEVSDSKEVEGISHIRDESNKKGLRVVIECKKDVSPETIAVKLFSKTNLQTSISYNQVALVDKTPKELGLKDCIEIYISHNIDCIIREAKFDLDKAKVRLEIIEGLLIALEDIDNVIKLIKTSESAAMAKSSLIKKYNLTENQAKAILDMKLAKLAKLEKLELENEKKDLIEKCKSLEALINNRDIQIETLKTRLASLVKKYGDSRRTEITNISINKKEKEIESVIPEDCVVILNKGGDIKRIPKKSFRVQKRNGKGIKTDDATVIAAISTNTIDNLLVFTNAGKMYRILVDNIPIGTNVSKGVSIFTLIPSISQEEKILAAVSLDRENQYKYIVFITKDGLVKKTELSEYKSIKRNAGTVAIKLKENDSIIDVHFMNEEDLILISKNGMGIRFETKTINAIGRNTSGVKSMKLSEDDCVLAAIPVEKSDIIGIFTHNGLGKKMKVSELPLQGRNGKGVKISNNVISGAIKCVEDESILLLGDGNSICITEKDVPLLTRASQGNIMIKGKINSVVRL